MISPINFRASVGSVAVDSPAKTENTKSETVTAPIETAASFKGAEALASYNKAILAADSADETAEKAPAFKGEETSEEPEEAPAFKGEDAVEETSEAEEEEISEETAEEEPAE